MKRSFILPLLAGLFFCACKSKTTGLLRPSNLNSSFINIDAGKDNVLKTAKGAVIKIAANSFDVPAGTKISIEVKEAYSMQDILRAGLTTMSNGKRLQSGGMIYFNARANDKVVKFLKPVSITIPSTTYNDSMKVFKGEIGSDSTINWVAPKTLDTSRVSQELALGNALYKANCASCHKTYQDLTGPMLAGSRDREPSKDWVYKFINNVNLMVYTDPYARMLKSKYGSVMTQFNLKKEEIKAILDYADNDARINKPEVFLQPETVPEGGFTNGDCGYDTIPVFNDTAIALVDTADTGEDIDTSFNEERPSYAFNIDESGWYNIDCFINNNNGLVSDVVLTATVNNAKDIILDVFLCIPNRKVLTEGNLLDDEYAFYEKQTRLIKGDEAFVYVLGLKGEQYYYGISRFVVKDEQRITVNLEKSTNENILEELRKNKVGNKQLDNNEPVIEEFINIDQPDSIKTKNSSDSTKMEMQILKKSCSGDSVNAIADLFNLQSK